MGMNASHPQPGTALDALDQISRGFRRQSELRSLMTSQYVGVCVSRYAGKAPYKDILGAPRRHDCLQPVDVVRAVDYHQTDAVLDGHRHLFGGLGITVQHDERWIHASLECGENLTATSDVEANSFLPHDALDRCAWKSLGCNDHP